MANRKTGIYRIDANIKFEDLKASQVFQKRIRDKIAYDIKTKGITVQAMIVISNTRKYCSEVRYSHNGKKGRPKKELIINETAVKKFCQGKRNTDYHLHILIISSPIDYGRTVKEYIDKNWCNNVSKVVYRKSCNIYKSNYYIDQSIGNSAFCSSNDFKYTLKQYHNEYIALKDKLRELHKQDSIKHFDETKLLNKQKKIMSNIKDMINYFNDFSIHYDTKRKEDYKNVKNNNNRKSKKGNKLPKKPFQKHSQTLLISRKNELTILPVDTLRTF